MQEIFIFGVLIAGIITGFLPCTFPLLFGYIALLLGTNKKIIVTTSIKISLLFFLGFALVYSFFGSVAGFFGFFSTTTLFFNSLKVFLDNIFGLVIILLGLVTLNFFGLPNKFKITKNIKIPSSLKLESNFSPFLVGAIFALSYSPCIGPVLGGVLILAASFESVLIGIFLLFVFSLGLMIPVFIISILYGLGSEKLLFFQRKAKVFQTIGGITLIIIGVLIFTNNIGFLTALSNDFTVDSFLSEFL